ncbi:histone-like nucleoid-structuring protein Lsr2 [Nonomuraea sp. MTCD27]|uniref:Lsr2 family DNA-binding protein n=1 Tax=Nonomuraea sp. MTCD27 TaxID=1676747 RepID=UPI0035C1A95C
MLKLLAAGKTTREVADGTSWPRDRVVTLARAQKGWLLNTATDRVYDPDGGPVTLSVDIAELADTHLPFELVARAEASADPALRKLAATVRAALKDISDRLVNAREAALVAEQVARLQRELQALQARHRQLTGGRKAPDVSGVRPAEAKKRRTGIRAWAASQGLDCPKSGRIPKHVEAAYDQAHEGDQ